MKINNFSLPFFGFLQATALLVYIGLVALVMFNANKIFGNVHTFLGPIAFILLFVVSATVSGLLVLGRAGYLFWEKQYKKAFTLLGWTLGWALIYLAAVFIILLTAKSS